MGRISRTSGACGRSKWFAMCILTSPSECFPLLPLSLTLLVTWLKYQNHYIEVTESSAGIGASLVAHLVKNLPAVRETWILSSGWEDPLEKGKAILAWIIPWTIVMGSQRVGHN